MMKKSAAQGESASALIDQRIKELGADSEIVEEWKWMGTPAFNLARKRK
jgi:hypothetical protein